MLAQWRNHISRSLALFAALLLCSPLSLAAEAVVESTEKVVPRSASVEQMLKMILGLMFVLALIFALAWAFRRFGNIGSAAGGSLKILAGTSVGPKERVVLIQLGERQMLLGVAPGQVNLLHTLEKDEVLDTRPEKGDVSSAFADKLKASMSRVKQS